MLKELDNYIHNNFEFASNNLKLSHGKFRVKLFSNGISIGNNTINVDDLKTIENLKYINVLFLLSIKGTTPEEFVQLQSMNANIDLFNNQINAIEKLMNLKLNNFEFQIVMGFYHSCYYNIKTPLIKALDMFNFNSTDNATKKLKSLIYDYIKSGKKVYVEPIHPPVRKKEAELNFYTSNNEFLQKDNLIEKNLKSNSKISYEKTELKNLFI